MVQLKKILSALQIIVHLILGTILRGRLYIIPIFHIRKQIQRSSSK